MLYNEQNTAYKCIASVPAKPDKSYIGLSEDEWKKHYYNHRKSFRNQRYQSETMLSSYVWEAKRAIDQIPSLKWSIITVLPAYSNIKHETLPTLLIRKICNHYISRS